MKKRAAIDSLFSDFTKDKSFEKLKEIIFGIKCPYFFLMDKDGKSLYSEGKPCQQVDLSICKKFIINGFLKIRFEKKAIVSECKEGFFGFFSPIFLNDDFIGCVSGCNIASCKVPLGFREIGGKSTKTGFVSFVDSEEKDAFKEILEREAGLISAYTSSSIKILFKDIELLEKEDEILAISESYRVFSGEYGAASSLGKQNLYFIMVDLISRAMGAEICSLMIIDKKKEEMRIEAAIGLDPLIMANTRVKIGEGIAGYVAKTGETLLVEDIDNDPRFKSRAYKSDRYHTKSLISAPLKANGDVFGVICVNNKTTREQFTKQDLDILNLLLSRIVKTANGEIAPSPIKFKETSDIILQNNALMKEIEEFRASALAFDRERMELATRITSLEKEIEIERVRSQELRVKSQESGLKSQEEDVSYLKQLVEKESLKREVLEGELSILREELKKKEEIGMGRIEEEVIEKFKEEAFGLLEKEKEPEDTTKELEGERERSREKDDKIRELQKEIEELKKEKIKEEVSLLQRQKEMMERIKAQKPKTEIDELSEQKEKIEALLRIKEKIEDVAHLYEEAKKIKDKKGEAIHRESLEKLKKQATELEELKAQTAELSFLYKISASLANILDENELFEKTLCLSEDYFGFCFAGYIILKENKLKGGVRARILYSIPRIDGLKKRMLNDWLRWNPIRKKGIKRDVSLKTIGEKGKTPSKIKAYISAPIKEKGKIIGVLSIASTKTSFSPTSLRILSILTDQISMAVERARLFLKEEELATRDELTGVFNFRYFHEAMERNFEIAKKRATSLSFIMLDFDHLKYINDTFGHNQGNRLIKTIAHLIEKSVRKEDIVGRFGGDEFGVILPGTEINIGGEIAERIRKEIAEHKIIIEEKPFSLTASLGVSFSTLASSAEDLMKIADSCLYRAKQEGRNRVVVP